MMVMIGLQATVLELELVLFEKEAEHEPNVGYRLFEDESSRLSPPSPKSSFYLHSEIRDDAIGKTSFCLRDCHCVRPAIVLP